LLVIGSSRRVCPVVVYLLVRHAYKRFFVVGFAV